MSLLLSLTTLTLTSAWNYVDEGPQTWSKKYPACGYKHGSPINIPSKVPTSCQHYNTTLNLNWNYNQSSIDYIIRNNGKTLHLEPILFQDYGGIKTFDLLNTNQNAIARLPNIWYNTYESHENKEYCLDSIHFHWGADSSVGSEHTFNGKYSAFEAHFLHYSCDYASLKDALTAFVDGKTQDKYVLAAIGVLFDVGEPNIAIEEMLKNDVFKEIYKVGGTDNSTHKILNIRTSFSINDLLPKDKSFITYHGGITAPPCFETVRWNVLHHKLTISEQQLNKFRSLLTHNNEYYLKTNFRPLQNNTNEVYYCPLQIDELMIEKNNNESGSHVLAIVIIAGSIIFFFICLIGVCRYNKKRKDRGFADLNSLSTTEHKDISMKRVASAKNVYSVYQ